VTKALSV